MKSGTCPKCNSTAVYNRSQSLINSEKLSITDFMSEYLDYYVCVNCGFVESYIYSQKAADKIVKKWEKVLKNQGTEQNGELSVPDDDGKLSI